MAGPIIQGDQAFLIDPQSGEAQAVPRDQIGNMLAIGFTPVGKDEHAYLAKKAYHDTGVGTAKSTALGALRGASLGLSDVGLRAAGAVTAEQLRDAEQFNPLASGFGEAAGALATAPFKLSPFGLAVTGGQKLGGLAAGQVAKATGKLATEALPRLAGGLVREGATGGIIGLGSGLSNIAKKDKITKGEAAVELLKSMGTGTLIGGGLGAAGWIAKEGGRKAVSRWASGAKELEDIGLKRKLLRDQIEAETLANATPARLEKLQARAQDLAIEYGNQRWEVVKKLTHRSIGMGIGTAMGGGFGTGAIGYLLAPKAIGLVSKALKPVGKSVNTTARRLFDRITPAVEGLAKKGRLGKFIGGATAAANKVMDNPVAAAAVRAGAAKAKETVIPRLAVKGQQAVRKGVEKLGSKINIESDIVQEALEAGGEAVGTTLGLIGKTPLKGAIAGGVAAGAEGFVGGLALSMAQKHGKGVIIDKVRDAISSKIAPLSRRSIISAMTDEEAAETIKQVTDFENDEIDAMMKMNAPTNMPAGMVDGVTEQITKTMDYIREHTPVDEDDLDGPRPESKVKLAERMKGIRAVIDTDSFFEDFSKGTLAQSQVDAWKQVYPQALRQLKAIVMAEVSAVKEEKGKFTNRQKRNIALITGQSGGIYDQKAVNDFQAMYEQEKQQAQQTRPAGGGRQLDIAGSHATQLQKTAARDRRA